MPAFQHDGKRRQVRIAGKAAAAISASDGKAATGAPQPIAEPARGGEPDAHAGEAARAAIDQDVRGAAPVRQRGDHRHQPLGMAATDDSHAPRRSPRRASISATEQAAVAVSMTSVRKTASSERYG